MIGYKVEIAKANTFTAASLVSTQTVASTTLALPTLADGIYYWRVRGVFGPDNALGPVSAAFVLKIDQTAPGRPLLTLPIPNAVVTNTRTPTVTWTAAAGTPTQYVIEIDDNADLNSPRHSVTITAPTLSHTLPVVQALSNGLYVWRVRARDAAGNLSAGVVRSFTIAAP